LDLDLFAPPPELLGERYRLGDKLGSGGSGVVHIATDEQTGDEVAVKMVEAPSVQRPLRFLAEARDMARIRHPRVVRVFDAGKTGHWYWTVMELMRGGSLRERVASDGPMAPDRALLQTFRILQGVSVVHNASLVHRDIKPHNVLLDEHDRPKITDFGLARHAPGDVPWKTRTGESLGSPSYRAPEQTDNPGAAGREADVYGTGAVLYWMLTAERPPVFYAMSDEEFLLATRGIPSSIGEIVRRATAYRPHERYRTAFEMAAAVARTYDALPERVGHPPMASRWLADFESTEVEDRPPSWWQWLRAKMS
jgi:serine/threonine protein kinase